MNKVLYEKKGRIAYVTLNRLEAINGYSSVGDFSEVRQRLDRNFTKTTPAA